MATGFQLKTKSDDATDLKALLQQTHNQALEQNDHATQHWLKIRDEHISLHSHLMVLPEKLSHEVMVPIGSKALMRGKMVHTNEILVCLGDGWFVKRSAKEAAEICDRRIKLCENMLKDLERERDLLTSRKEIPLTHDAFGAADRDEIVEPYDEEKEAQWRIEHRKKEKEYRSKLKELQERDKTVIEDEESLWKRLEELELQEELQEELDRLHAESSGREDEDEDSDREEEEEEEDSDDESQRTESEYVEEEPGDNRRNIVIPEHSAQSNESSNSEKPKSSGRRVSFADERTSNENKDSDSDSDSSAETLRIEFHHTPLVTEMQQPKTADQHPIQTPGDIHAFMKEQISKDIVPKSILKNKSYDDLGPQRMPEVEVMPSDDSESHEELEEQPPVFGDVLERDVRMAAPLPEPPAPARPTSRFKAARMASKR